MTTDVLLIITIMLLLWITCINLQGGVYSEQYYPHVPCSAESITNRYQEPRFAPDGVDLDEVINHPRSRGAVPHAKQPHHTKNLWKSAGSQPYVDEIGRRHTTFSSDMITPYKDQYKLMSVDPDLREVRPPQIGSSMFEELHVDPDNPIENERNPVIRKILV